MNNSAYIKIENKEYKPNYSLEYRYSNQHSSAKGIPGNSGKWKSYHSALKRMTQHHVYIGKQSCLMYLRR